MKAILIARVSTEEQKEMGHSLPAQMARLERYCQNKGFEIIKVCSFDESAYTDQRNEFDIIMDFILAQKEKIAVCCDKVDRLSRNMFDTRVAKLYDKALNDEIELHFISDGQIITSRISATEKFQFSMSLGLANYFSNAISDNVKRAIEQKLRKGEWTGKAPYGYKNVTLDNGRKDVIVDEVASQVVRKAFELYATGAFSMGLLCNKIKTDYGVVWSVSQIDQIFNNPFYYGQMLIKGTMYPHRYPPLVTKALFDQVQQTKSGFNKKPFKYAGKPYIYRGLMRCDECGLAITPENHKGIVYYHCTQYNGKHGAKWLREDAITQQLGKVFKRLQMPQEILEGIVNTLSEVHHNKIDFQSKQFDDLTKKQKEITKILENLYLDKLKGRITDDEFDNYRKTFCEQRDDINARLMGLQEAENNYYITAKYLLELASSAYDVFVGSEVEEKRLLIKLVLSNLRVKGEKIVYDAQMPFSVILNCSEDQVWLGRKDSNLRMAGPKPAALPLGHAPSISKL